MFVCLCSQLGSQRVKAAIAAGARTPDEVFSRLRLRRNCGNCLGTIRRLIAEAGESPSLTASADPAAAGNS